MRLADIIKDDDIYPRVQKDDYRAIAESYFNKKLQPDEVVHHIDGNHNNNAPENLVIMKKSQHLRLHSSLAGALKDWQRRVRGKHTPCNTCQYVRFYEDYEHTYPKRVAFRAFMYPFANSIVRDFHPDWFITQDFNGKDNVGAKDWAELFYLDAKRWKEQNHHDCYKQQNMSVVKEESSAF